MCERKMLCTTGKEKELGTQLLYHICLNKGKKHTSVNQNMTDSLLQLM